MNINIVCETTNNAGVLMRLAQTLSRETGWPVNSKPDKHADINYWMCYIEHAEKYSDWHQTPTAAWFTHYEAGTPYKEFWWQLSSETIDLRLTSAQQYADMLDGYGPTALVTPPVDRMHFNIRNKISIDRPRVGVSGWATHGDRKGVKLIARLAGSDLGQTLDIVASGQGWPVHTKEWAWEDLPDYYNSLDVLLCPSLIEGIPMPPLEALACGVPVVIPRGVGLLDDLPEAPGIYRYDAGDYDTMEDAVKQAVRADDIDRTALREAVAMYTPESWARTHEQVFADFLRQRNDAGILSQAESDRHGRRGVYYVAYGEQARNCAKAAIASFQKHMPGIEVALASDRPLCTEDHLFTLPDLDIGGRSAKVQVYDVVPGDWEYILYLDADTEVIADISFLYKLLEDGFDMVICKNPDKYHVATKMQRSDNADECQETFVQIGTDEVLQLNGGVFAFQRNQRTAAFFHTWYAEWQRYGKRDQAALLRALWKHPLKLCVLGNEWNTITRYANKESSAGILHFPMCARRWRGQIAGRSDSAEAWRAVRQFQGGAR